MNAERWSWILQAAEISIDESIPHLLARSQRFRQQILQAVRSDGWVFSEDLALALGEPALPTSPIASWPSGFSSTHRGDPSNIRNYASQHNMPMTNSMRRNHSSAVQPFRIDSINSSFLGSEVRNFRDNVERYIGPSPISERIRSSNDYQRYLERIEDTRTIIADLDGMDDGDILDGSPADNIFICRDNNGNTVGIITLRKSISNEDGEEIIFIDQIVTHPGSSGAGEILMEEAVNYSIRSGVLGRLRLDNYNRGEFYESIGFQRSGRGHIYTLDPRMSSEWMEIEGKWVLRRRAHKLEFTSHEVSVLNDDQHSRHGALNMGNRGSSFRPIVLLRNWDDVRSRSWNRQDRFQIIGPDGTPQFFEVLRNRFEGDALDRKDFLPIVIGG